MTRWRAPDRILVASLLLFLAAITSVAFSDSTEHREAASRLREAFDGGVGLGWTLDLSRCAGAFDGRVGGSCDFRFGPVPSSEWLCPDHLIDHDAVAE